MASIKSLNGKAKIVDLGSQMRIEIPLRPQGFDGLVIVVFSIVWLTGWGIGGVVVSSWLLHCLGLLPYPVVPEPKNSESILVYGCWLLFWVILGGIACQHLVNTSFGREVIVVTPTSLSVIHRPIGFMRLYKLSEISNLRVVEKGRSYSEFTGWFIGLRIRCDIRWTIAFNYGAKTEWLGIGLDPVEARQIVALIKERFGQFMKADKTS